jgi:hypothetical protein
MFVQEKLPRLQQGSSALAIYQLGKEKGYEPVSVTVNNIILVHRKYYPLFGIADNSLNALRKHRDLVTYIFTGYDGTVLLAGSRRMPWHQVPFWPTKFQHLPKWLRCYPDSYGPLQRLAYRVIRRFWLMCSKY